MSGSFTEVIRPKAFARTLGENPDVSLLVNHSGAPLARSTSGTLTLREDARGLRFAAQLEPDGPRRAIPCPEDSARRYERILVCLSGHAATVE